MDKFGRVFALLCFFFFFFFFFIFVVVFAKGDVHHHHEEEDQDVVWRMDSESEEEPSSSFSTTFESVLVDTISLLTVTSSAPPLPLPFSLTSLIHQLQSYLFPPKIDFRGGGGKETVKEAIIKSMETSKETVEDSAKSAADFTTQTLDNTKDKLFKKTLSHHQEKHDL